MALYFASLNSGSNGNCYYVGNEKESVLIDAGISCRETVKRMERLGLSIHTVKAIFISHEHTDHTSGARVLSKKFRIPVFITDPTHRNSRLWLDADLRRQFVAHTPVEVGSLKVTAFPKHHDASDPHSFLVSEKELTVGVMTDIGSACRHVEKGFSQCQAVFLEANYDEDMLENGRYPRFLKDRIAGNDGHLSNRQALELFLEHRSPQLCHLILSHLSKENNHPQLVKELFSRHACETRISVASRYAEVGVFSIS